MRCRRTRGSPAPTRPASHGASTSRRPTVRCIRITQTDGTAWTRDLDRARLDVGREHDNDIVLPHGAVSRRHCLLEYDGAMVIVKDRGTANGTFLNNAHLSEPRVLQEGDKLYVGPFLLEL